MANEKLIGRRKYEALKTFNSQYNLEEISEENLDKFNSFFKKIKTAYVSDISPKRTLIR